MAKPDQALKGHLYKIYYHAHLKDLKLPSVLVVFVPGALGIEVDLGIEEALGRLEADGHLLPIVPHWDQLLNLKYWLDDYGGQVDHVVHYIDCVGHWKIG